MAPRSASACTTAGMKLVLHRGYRGNRNPIRNLGIAHTFTIESPAARTLIVNTPGGFEQMFKLAPQTPEEAIQALNTYGMEVVGPHPRETASA